MPSSSSSPVGPVTPTVPAGHGDAALFLPLRLRGLVLPNRIVMSPMCTYSATAEGRATPWHAVHLASRAMGGVGLVMTEATAVSPEGRITPGDLGLWEDAQIGPLRQVTRLIEEAGAVPGIQLAHAGRKGGRTIPWHRVGGSLPLEGAEWGALPAPSPVAYTEGWPVPEPLTVEGVDRLAEQFAHAAERAEQAGFKVVELHFAHGYLLHEFLSPLSNHREDDFGGSPQRRAEAPLRVVRAVRAVWPERLPLLVRLSVRDWAAGGITIEETVALAAQLRAEGVDLVDCSAGAVVPETVPAEPGYLVPDAARIRREAGTPTGAVGLILAPRQAEAVVAEGHADLVFLGRALLRDAYWARSAAEELAAENSVPLPLPYRRAVQGMAGRSQW